MQVVSVAALDPHGRNLSDPQRAPASEMDRTVDLGGIALAPAFGPSGPRCIDNYLFALAYPSFQALQRNRLLVGHQAVPALVFDVVGDGGGEIVGHRAGDRLVTETADAIELGFGQPFQ